MSTPLALPPTLDSRPVARGRWSRRPRRGSGTAWLVFDGSSDGSYLCFWYGGAQGDHLLEQGHAADASEAVAWGRERTPRVRIRTADHRTSWAGSAPRPDSFAHTWVES